MPFFGNKRRDFSIQPPKQQVDGTPFYVTDSSNIDFTLDNLNLTADLTFTGVTAGTYGDATHIPILQIDQWGRVTGVTTVPIGGGPGGTYTVNNGLTENPANNFQLGGATLGTGNLVRDTYINNDDYIFRIDQGTAAAALFLSTIDGDGLISNIDTGNAVSATVNVSGNAFRGITIDDYVTYLTSEYTTATNNENVGILKLERTTNGTSSGGIGGSIDFWIQARRTGFPTPPAPTDPTVRLSGIWEIPGPLVSSRLSRFDIYGYSSGGSLLNASIGGDGKFYLYQYGQTPANFPGTPVRALGVDVNGNVIEFTATGTVTSVAATVPSVTNPFLSVNVPNPTITPSINLTANGLVSQYVRGDGSLANFPTNVGGGSSVSYYLNGSVNQGTFGGNVYYQMSRTANTGPAADFTINADGYIAQFITDSNDPSLLNIPGGNWDFQIYFSASSSGGSPQFYAELYKYDGTSFTLISSGSTSPENITTGTFADVYISTLTVPQTTLAITDRLAIRIYVIHSGRIITMYTQDSKLAEVHTTFSTGIAALNGLTAQVQSFANGTTGAAPSWSSTTSTHTLNIPLASAASVTAGLISKADYDVFNGKQNTITLTTTGTSGPATLTGATLNIPQYGGGSGGNSIASLSAASGDVSAAATSASETNVVATLKANLKTGSFGVTVDGITSVVQVGQVGYVVMPYDGTITRWTITSNVSGSISFDIWKDASIDTIPTIGDSIVGGVYPLITGTNFGTSTNLTSWTSTTFSAGHIFGFYVNSASTIKNATLTLRVTKT